MLKKLIAISLVFTFLNVHAAAPVSNLKALASAYDKLNFALTVEWDQKDKDFYSANMKQFKKTLVKLRQEGLNNVDLVKFAQTKIKNKQAAKEIETLFNVVEINKLSDTEAREFILNTVEQNRTNGSNWLGSELSTSAFIALLVVLAIIIASTESTGGGSYDGGYYENCYDDYVCWDVCYDYSSCYSQCGWETTCY